MTRPESGRPAAAEYGEYYGRYIGKIEGTDIVVVLEDQLRSSLALLRTVDETAGNFRYGPDKWSLKEVVGHMIDTERVFTYRALVFARGDETALPGFDQDRWVTHANYARAPLAGVVDEFEAVRRSTILLLRHLDPEAWTRKGVANGMNWTTRSAAFVIAGHLEHHIEILRTRYLAQRQERGARS